MNVLDGLVLALCLCCISTFSVSTKSEYIEVKATTPTVQCHATHHQYHHHKRLASCGYRQPRVLSGDMCNGGCEEGTGAGGAEEGAGTCEEGEALAWIGVVS